MADKYDTLFYNFFSGKFPLMIELRITELKVHNNHDENIGGGHIKNHYFNSVEADLSHFEEDEQLTALKIQQFILTNWFKTLPPERQQVIKQRYSVRRPSWQQIAMANNISERTARKWRDEFKATIATWLK